MKKNKKNIVNLLLILATAITCISKFLAIPFILIVLFMINYNFPKKEENKKTLGLLSGENIRLNKQIELYNTKTKILNEILSTTFSETSITYMKFNGTIKKMYNLFDENIKNIKFQLSLIDEEKLLKYHTTKELQIINKLFKDNDLLLNKLNNLIIEVSEINNIDDETKLMALTDEMNELNLIIKKIQIGG